MRRIALLLLVVGTLVTSCASDDSSSNASSTASSTAASLAASAAGTSVATVGDVATISPQQASSVLDSPPADLVVLDVRTPEEYAAGHIDGAVQVDFYDEDFADQLGQLDPTVPYLVYCQSGNRSGQTLTMMEQLGFASASDVDGGIVAWQNAGLPVVVE